MTTDIVHYEAEQCHTGGYLCGHHHRSREAASRCLPGLPTGRGCFSMASVKTIACKCSDNCRCTLMRADDDDDENDVDA